MTDSLHTHDIIITGMGCAGMSLASRLVQAPFFSRKKILILDRDQKNQNDRTWCFWEKGEGYYESLVYRRWPEAWVHGPGFSKSLPLRPYSYKMIRGRDFYAHHLPLLQASPQVTILQEEVRQVESNGRVTTASGTIFQAPLVFNSIPSAPVSPGRKGIWMHQHFKGWVIRTAEPVFDPGKATLMDFRVSQQEGTCFVYVMPFNTHEALVEYTLFSGELLAEEAYESGLKQYIHQYITTGEYQILEKEFGIIPMTNYRFPKGEGAVVPIGTQGGQTKGSSGYTFQFIQKQSDALVAAMIAGRPLHHVGRAAWRFRFYDQVLLDVLHQQRMSGDQVFTRLFRKNPTPQVFKFLDNESSISEEASVILSLPVGPFLKAALHQLF